MAVYASRSASQPVADDLGVMGGTTPSALVQPAASGDVPAAPETQPATQSSAVPEVPADASTDAAVIDKDQDKN